MKMKTTVRWDAGLRVTIYYETFIAIENKDQNSLCLHEFEKSRFGHK
jgi:hypothetical protein